MVHELRFQSNTVSVIALVFLVVHDDLHCKPKYGTECEESLDDAMTHDAGRANLLHSVIYFVG